MQTDNAAAVGKKQMYKLKAAMKIKSLQQMTNV